MAANDKLSNKGGGDRDKSLETALAQIERQFGRGAIMRLGDETRAPIEVIPTGAISLDVALGIGGFPRGRVVEIYGPESSGKTSLALHAIANAQKAGGIAAIIDAEHALDPDYAKKLGVDTDALLVSQPDTGEQALEIDPLWRDRHHRHRLRRRAGAARGDRGRDGGQPCRSTGPAHVPGPAQDSGRPEPDKDDSNIHKPT
jgi:hypothetical protein